MYDKQQISIKMNLDLSPRRHIHCESKGMILALYFTAAAVLRLARNVAADVDFSVGFDFQRLQLYTETDDWRVCRENVLASYWISPALNSEHHRAECVYLMEKKRDSELEDCKKKTNREIFTLQPHVSLFTESKKEITGSDEWEGHSNQSTGVPNLTCSTASFFAKEAKSPRIWTTQYGPYLNDQISF
jgi:hypothetical protein